MKKIILVLALGLFAVSSFAQSASESTIKRISLGYDIYNSFWLNMPAGVDTRLVNQGINVFAMYNHDLNENGLSVAAGLGVSSENLFLTDDYIADVYSTEEIEFTPLPDGITAARNKINFTYLDIPLELRLQTENNLRFGLGFKFGILMDSKTYYKGDAFDRDETSTTYGTSLGYTEIVKNKDINQLEKYRFGVQLRAGYKWVQVYGYYALNKVFIADKGPQMQPIQVGITFMPF